MGGESGEARSGGAQVNPGYKRGRDPDGDGEGRDSSDTVVQLVEIQDLIGDWVTEIQQVQAEELEEDMNLEKAWDDVKGGELPIEKVKEARKEEVTFMESRKLWHLVPEEECWEKTGKSPVSMRWVDTNKGEDLSLEWEIRCRLLARDFKGGEKHRDDLFAETPPLEARGFYLVEP